MIFEVECDTTKQNELTDRTHTRIVSFIVLDMGNFVKLHFFDVSTLILILENIRYMEIFSLVYNCTFQHSQYHKSPP